MTKEMDQQEWGYTETNGPFSWYKQYPIASQGKRQSPINIVVVTDKNVVCCTNNNVSKEPATKCISSECLRQRMTQNLSLHEQSQNTGNIHKRSYHHNNHHHHNHNRHHHIHQQHRLRDHHHNNSSPNENDDFILNSTGNSPVGESSSSSASSVTAASTEPSTSSSSSVAAPSSSSSSSMEMNADDYMADDNDGNNNNGPSCKNNNRQNFGNSGQVNYYQSHKKIFLGYPRSLNNLHVTNTGHGWQVNIPSEISHHTLLSGPPLGDRHFRLAQFHCHWGSDCDHGSEHLINGKGFAAELHFVHWNSTDFDSVEEASKHKHGLAVLGVVVQAIEGEQNRNKYLDKIIQSMDNILEPGSSSRIHDHFDIKKLFPANRWMYATYEGSLTTPPLSEVVDWVVFLNPVQASTAQIESFRRLRCDSGKNVNLINNCRPVQPVLDRSVNIWTHH